MDDILGDLNEQQRDAVSHGDGPLLIVAGAGTGKTMALAHRVAHLITKGANPGRILLLTFTRRAAAEMLNRVDGILRRVERTRGASAVRRAGQKVWGGTFHAVATRLLRLHGKAVVLDPGFSIHDRGDSEDLMNVVRTELGLAKSKRRFPSKSLCSDIYSRCVNTRDKLETVLEEAFPWCREDADDLKKLFQTYVDRKQAQSVLDYDDLLLYWHGLMGDAASGAAVRSRFDHVLVDEYQDTNTLQSEILHRLCPDGEGLTVVGDDAQSIYSFRAATVRNILDFPKDFADTTIVTLEQNYRSTQPILDATNHVIAQATERHSKNLWSQRTGGGRPLLVTCLDESEQTEFVITHILEHREAGIDLRKQAVLYRASHHSLDLELELARRNIPFHKYGGLKFVETAHVKDLLAFMRLAENPRDLVPGIRVLCLIPGIGPRRAHKLMESIPSTDEHFAAWQSFKPPSAAAELWPVFLKLLSQLVTASAKELPSQVHAVRKFYGPLLEDRYDNARARLRDLEQLEQLASRFTDRETFLTELTLDPPASTQDLAGPPLLDDDYLILSTVHSAKGLEWDAVYVIHAADGNIPSDMATSTATEIEEELRLFYVALTRAKNALYVCFPQRYYFHNRHRSDAHSFAQVTRFLPEDVLTHFDRRNAQPDMPRSSGTPDPTTATDIRKAIRDMWA